MNPNAEFANGFATRRPQNVQFFNGGLYFQSGPDGVTVLFWVWLGTAEDRQEGIADEFVNCSSIGKNDRHRDAEIIVEHFHDAVRLHFLSYLREAADVGIQNSHFVPLPAQAQAAALGQ